MPSRRPAETGRRAAAEQLAIAALGFVAADPEQLGRFLAITGIGPESIREAAREPQFLAGVLEHVTSDEALLIAFASAQAIAPEAVMRASELLAGGRWERDTP
ncbi:MAG: DUF3572 domain-containing protein [Hyphomicrobiales bacterium]|nr:DUF3572 domain-containing protein [Hyphomicrobiales bacterium]